MTAKIIKLAVTTFALTDLVVTARPIGTVLAVKDVALTPV